MITGKPLSSSSIRAASSENRETFTWLQPSTPNRRTRQGVLEMPTVSAPGLVNRRLKARVFETNILLPHSLDHVFAFFADAANLERITPPALHFRILTPMPIPMGVGTLIQYRLRLFGIPFGWTTRIAVWNPPCCFVDEQIHGPYRLWVHTHTFHAVSKGVRMHDHVQWALPLYPVGEWAAPVIGALIAWIFRYRARTIPALLQERHTPIS